MAFDLVAERDNVVHNSTRVFADSPFHDGLSADVGNNAHDPRCSTVFRVEIGAVDGGLPSHVAIRGIGHGPAPGIVGHGGHDAPGVMGVGGGNFGSGVVGVTKEMTAAPLTGYLNGVGVIGQSESRNTIGVMGDSKFGTGVRASSYGSFGVDAFSDQHVGVRAQSQDSYAIYATNDNGKVPAVYAESQEQNAIEGYSRKQSGILGRSVFGAGVHGLANQVDGALGNGSGVLGEATVGTGVEGKSDGSAGVLGRSRYGAGVSAVSDEGNGLEAKGQRYAAILAVNSGPFNQSVGVVGKSVVGLGGEFAGGAAQIRLIPSAHIGAPTDIGHQKGELFLDANADLFICVQGPPIPVWKRVSLV